MVPNKRSIFDLFDGKKRYEVPLFQRQYVWNKENQWEPLWEDLIHKFKQQLTGKPGPKHFLGAAVLEQKKTFGNQIPTHIVIDGQQRLTTFQIFLAAYRDVCRYQASKTADEAMSNMLTSRAKEVERYVVNDGVMEDENVEQFKVWPTQSDQHRFREAMSCSSKESLEKLHPARYKRRKLLPRPNLICCYLFFHQMLYDYLNDSEMPGDIQKRADAAFFALRDDFQIVSIELESSDDAQVIFETLNARGAPLLPSDLLRNFIFLRAGQNKEDQNRLHAEYWSRFDNPFWREEERQGRLQRVRIDLFLHHYLTSKTLAEINSRNIFSEYKDWVLRHAEFKSIEHELKELVRYGEFFRGLIIPDTKSSFGKLAIKLKEFDTRTVYPLILWILGADLSSEERDGMFRDIEAYIVRRAICERSPKSYNKIFLRLCVDLAKIPASRFRLREMFRSLKGESEDFPNDDQFQHAWLHRDAYGLGWRANSVLRAINESMHTSKNELVEIHSTQTIEHVMPQNWFAHWPLQDGSQGLQVHERLLATEPEREKQSHDRDRILQTFGNLTLLTSPLNISISNASYSEKRPEITKQSTLLLNNYFQDKDEWSETAILERGRALFESAKRLWPYPDEAF